MPLHAGLTNEEQMSIFETTPAKCRKVIISTNIAEASVTIDGIRYVVDCGFVKMRVFNPLTDMDVLRVTPTSRASANQRAGRAGRTSTGKCIRLYPEASFASLPSSTPPEICRSDVSLFVLQLKALGIDNIVRFDFMTPPPSRMLDRALEYLYSLGAIDDLGRLTRPLGTRMAEVRLDLLLLADHGCSNRSRAAASRSCYGQNCRFPLHLAAKIQVIYPIAVARFRRLRLQ